MWYDINDPKNTAFLRNYGVIPMDGVVAAGEEDRGSYYGDVFQLMPYMQSMDMTMHLTASGMDLLLMPYASAFETPAEPTGSLTTATVLKTGPNAYVRKVSDGVDSAEKQPGDVTGEISVGLYAHRMYANGNVSRLFALGNSATVTAGYASAADNYAGGIVGNNNATVKNCFNQGSVSGMMCVGGVIGEVGYYMGGSLANCYYLSGCAKDGNGTVQNGIGASNVGQSEADEEGSTMAVTAEQLASGEVAYLLNGSTSEGTLAWGQTLDGEDKDSHPVLGGAKVYQTTNCAQTICYSNKATPIISHVYVNGFCTLCDGYEAATQNADGAYVIDNAGKLYWFADKVNSDYENFGAANAVLTADIVINENVLVNGALNPDADVVAKFRQWKTTIGSDALNVFAGTFDGDDHSISGLYFDDINS